jgi:hypothetical protein
VGRARSAYALAADTRAFYTLLLSIHRVGSPKSVICLVGATEPRLRKGARRAWWPGAGPARAHRVSAAEAERIGYELELNCAETRAYCEKIGAARHSLL